MDDSKSNLTRVEIAFYCFVSFADRGRDSFGTLRFLS